MPGDVDETPAGGEAAANGQVGTGVDGGEQPGEVGGIVGTVRVHLAHHRRPGEPGSPQAGRQRTAQALPLRAMEHRDRAVAAGQLVGQVPGPVGRSVVDDQHAGILVEDAGDDAAQGGGFVVGREDHDHVHGSGQRTAP